MAKKTINGHYKNHNINANNYRFNKPYKIYPKLDDGTYYIYHFGIGFGATFKEIYDIKKFLDGDDYYPHH
jgi:hypothetical protein